MDIENMTPRRPYMLRAFYDWLVENDLTPHLVVDATLKGVRVPLEFVQDGQVILNVAPRAVGNLDIGIDSVSFNARFSGTPHAVLVPIYAVQAIYARENGAGTMFEPEDAYLTDSVEESIPEQTQEPSLSVAEAPSEDEEGGDEPPRTKGKPSLRVIK
ncbi:ClpXP protease specificity-enhancing factor [Vibrio sp. RC27]